MLWIDAIRAKGAAGRVAAVSLSVSCMSMGLAVVASAGGPPSIRPAQLAPGTVPSGFTALGPVASSQTIALSVVLPPSNQSDLQALLQDLYDPQSPQYQQWLRPAQFVADFGPSPTAVSAVESWLHGAGLTSTSFSGFAVQASAPASEVSTALGTPFERYRTPSGSAGYLAQQTPLVPESLASGQISAILGLNTLTQFEPQNTPAPAPLPAGTISTQPEADGLTPCTAAQDEANDGYYTLDQLGAAYGIGSLLTDGQNGHGQTIGVYELASHSASDVTAYKTCFGLTNPITTVAVDGGGGAVGGDGTMEADLDIEQVATQAPGVSVLSYEGPNTATGAYDTWYAIVHADVAQVISASWALCEPLASEAGELSSYPTLFQEAAAQGQTVLAAAGDWGSEGCYVSDGDTTQGTAEEVDYPASDADVTAVGGTELLGPGNEVAWNYCQSDESVACANSDGGYAAGGGGMSRYIQRPTWQPNILSWPAAQACGLSCREVPDISANAGVGMVIYSDGGWMAVIGTSAAAPLLAGLVADTNDGCTKSAGLWMRALYPLASEGAYGTALTDITSGNNDMTGSNGGNYPAMSGYDAATGLGSPEAAGLSCPEITSIQPAEANPGSQVTLSGLGLERATISFGGTAAQVLSATATAATVVVPAGSGVVTVDGSSVLGVGTQGSSFTYPSSSIAPAIVSVSPSSGPVAGGQSVTIDGSEFEMGASVTFGGSRATGVTVISISQLTAVTPPGTGTVSVTVTNPDGGSASDPSAYRYGTGGGYTLDAYGGVHPFGDSPPVTTTGYWPGWQIARAIHMNPCDTSGQISGWVMDGFGGLHPFAAAGTPMPAAPYTTGYWPGWTIANDFAAFCINVGGVAHAAGCVLDGFGGLHPWADSGAVIGDVSCNGTGYWPGWDIATKITVIPGTDEGYVMDGFGGLHPFNRAPNYSPSGYWPGWTIARGIVATASGGYTVDALGGIHPFGSAPAITPSGYWPGWDIVTGIAMASGGTGAYTLDGFGGVHPAGGAPSLTVSGYWPGWDIAIGLVTAP